MKIATAEQMLLCDRLTSAEYGISGLELMENAGRGTVAAMSRHFGSLVERKVLIFVGPGNNGGDGLVIARLLLAQGAQPQVVSLVALEKMQGDAARNLERVKQLAMPLYTCLAEEELSWVERLVAESDFLVDALFGTGLRSRVSGVFAAVIKCLNASPVPVVAVDIPSGLASDTGIPQGTSVRAHLTCTYGLPKFAQVEPPGKEYVGELEVIDIGIPVEVVERIGVAVEWLDHSWVKGLIPARGLAAHKGTFGHLLALAGSLGKGGAAVLCGLGGLRSGAGLVTIATPKALNGLVQGALPEAMTEVLSFSQHCLSEPDYEQLLAACHGKGAVAVGPGLGTAEETGQVVRKLYRELRQPMVVDADGLNLLAGEVAVLAAGPRVLTPHPGEMSRLAGISTLEIQGKRREVAADFAKRHGVVLLLKGASTVIAAPDGRVAINSTGNPGMAAGGMGDVLTGLIGGLLAQGVPPWEAACLGAYVHGLAADRIVRAGRPFGFLASELAAEIPGAFQEVLQSGGAV
ncbi:NAD(P)H-hydrate dehydratase [Thiovibrio frasassiensis]|uniref:Bifunctional NAD(P)H-hydrate repair enzyme n=1 Tax=Thiovibrio frasassiensis TaxID=2984131 RepID=A0A9X4RMI3_9BACT|nr:NAD(P)H-hydrate dehydratase [Thiovibrio frasassiensis]MDG4476213.1 NAD(P)H-hydrate dehydratase [Thiovibrio frasassiensis]